MLRFFFRAFLSLLFFLVSLLFRIWDVRLPHLRMPRHYRTPSGRQPYRR